MKEQSTNGVMGRKLRLALAFVVILAVMAPVAVIAAGGTFTDDDASIFEGDIEWMAANAITSGCGTGLYCPEDNVTRGQMAAFMKRLATKKVVDAATAVTADSATTADTATQADNADAVDGYHANALNRVAFDIDEQGSPVTVSGLATSVEVLTAVITAPRGGYITISGQIGITHDADGIGATLCQITVDDLDGAAGADFLDGGSNTHSFPAAGEINSCVVHGAFTSTFGGTYTVNLNVGVFIDAVDVDTGTLIVEYTPFNGAGFGPLIIILPPIITMSELADQVAVTVPEVSAQLSEIKAALNN